MDGALYEEGTERKVLAKRAEKTVIGETGERKTDQFAEPGELFKLVQLDEWNEYQVIARGHNLKAVINGRLMSEVIDQDKMRFRTSGKLGLQLHGGPAMQVQFKEVLLKK